MQRIGPWPANLPVIQDARYLFDAARLGARFTYVAGVGAYYRVSPTSLSHRNQARFIHDCAVNAAEIEALWRAEGTLSPTRQAALATIWSGITTAALLKGLDDFETARLGYNRAAARRTTFEAGRVRQAADRRARRSAALPAGARTNGAASVAVRAGSRPPSRDRCLGVAP